MLVNLDRVFPFFPSRLQLGWCFFNFSSCDFFLSKGYLVPSLKCNNDGHRGYYLDGVFSKKTIVAINRTVFFPKVPRWLLISPCAQISSEEYLGKHRKLHSLQKPFFFKVRLSYFKSKVYNALHFCSNFSEDRRAILKYCRFFSVNSS